MAALACVCALAPAALLAPDAMAEGVVGNSFSELTRKSEEASATTATTAANTTSSESNSNTSKVLILVALGAAVVLLSGIGFVIVRDARRVAPAGEADLGDARASRDTAAQMRKRRAKAKAARQQRKRNR
jgi:hypothetical protein